MTNKTRKSRKVKRMKISQNKTGNYSLIPHKTDNDPYSLPATKGDLHELKDALIWPPEITRNVYGSKMLDILKEHKELLTTSTRMTPQEIIHKSIDLSGQFYTANKKFFEQEMKKGVPDQPVAPKPEAPKAPPEALKPSPTLKASPRAIERTVIESKKKRHDIKRKLLKELREEEERDKLKKTYEAKKKSTQTFYKQLRLAGKIK